MINYETIVSDKKKSKVHTNAYHCNHCVSMFRQLYHLSELNRSMCERIFIRSDIKRYDY